MGARDAASSSHGFTGGVFGVNYGARVAELVSQDGTSNTILINELRVGINQGDHRGAWAMGVARSSLTAANAIGDCLNPNDNQEKSDDIEDCTALRNIIGKASVGMGDMPWDAHSTTRRRTGPIGKREARSQHPGVVQACFCDGSTQGDLYQ